jgi:hypothetical protein
MPKFDSKFSFAGWAILVNLLRLPFSHTFLHRIQLQFLMCVFDFSHINRPSESSTNGSLLRHNNVVKGKDTRYNNSEVLVQSTNT